MLSEASSLVRLQCTRLPKYRCSQRPRPWLDTSAPVCPSIDAPRSFRMPFSLSGTVLKATTTTGFCLLLMPDLAICPLSLPHFPLFSSLSRSNLHFPVHCREHDGTIYPILVGSLLHFHSRSQWNATTGYDCYLKKGFICGRGT